MKKISTLLLCIVLAAALALAATAVGCKSSGTDKPNENQGDNDMNNDKIIATIEMENGGVMKLELYPEIAPQSVYNFVSLARSGFYDGLTFHRIIPGFMIQGGDPLGEGHGGPGYSIKGEFASNGFNNTSRSMALPRNVRIPNVIRSSGIKIQVTALTNRPPVDTTSPFFTGFRLKFQQNPDRIIKLQQILCCHIIPGNLQNQLTCTP